MKYEVFNNILEDEVNSRLCANIRNLIIDIHYYCIYGKKLKLFARKRKV